MTCRCWFSLCVIFLLAACQQPAQVGVSDRLAKENKHKTDDKTDDDAYKNACLSYANTHDSAVSNKIKYTGSCETYLNTDTSLKPEYVDEYNRRKQLKILDKWDVPTR